MPGDNEEYIEVNGSYDTEEFCTQVMKGMLFGFLQVDIHILNERIVKFREFCPFFVMDSIPGELIPSHMCEYQRKTG